jgi:ABC-2 type transport system ATP-binding protein
MITLLRTLADRPGRSLLLSTHLLGDVERVCDQVVMLNSGTLLASGRLADLRSAGSGELLVRVKGDSDRFAGALRERSVAAHREGDEFRFARPPGGEIVVFAAARDAGVQVRYLGPSTRTMEELFLSEVHAATREAGA